MDSHLITVWHGEIAASEGDDGHYCRLLDQCELEHANTIKNVTLRRRYVETRARLRILLGRLASQTPSRLRILAAEHGKPYLLDYPDLAFNLSHTENQVVVATAVGHQLGIDIEAYQPRGNLAALVARCFADEERVYWQQLPETEQAEIFYQFWTRKEAFVKATGRGLALGLNKIVFNPENLDELLKIPTEYGKSYEWFIKEIALGKPVCGALVATSKKINPSNMKVVYSALPDLN